GSTFFAGNQYRPGKSALDTTLKKVRSLRRRSSIIRHPFLSFFVYSPNFLYPNRPCSDASITSLLSRGAFMWQKPQNLLELLHFTVKRHPGKQAVLWKEEGRSR